MLRENIIRFSCMSSGISLEYLEDKSVEEVVFILKVSMKNMKVRK